MPVEPAAGQFPDVTPGFPNVPQTPGQALSGLIAPGQGRTAILAYHNGILFTVPEQPASQPGADFLVRTWSLADPSAPQLLTIEGITPQPVNAHGYFKSGDYLVLGHNWPPGQEWSFRATTPLAVERGPFPDLICAGVRGCVYSPWVVTDTFWSYGEVSGDATLSLRGQELGRWDHLGLTGVIGHPFLIGNLLLFASDQSRTGIAAYDVSDPANPVLIDVLTDGGPGGYWPELWGGDGKLYAVFPYRIGGNGMRVADITDPTDMRFVADVSLPGASAMYAQFQDEYAFIGDHKVDMRTFQSVLDFDSANVERPGEPGVFGMDISQFALPLGNLLIGGGAGVNEGMSVWAHQAAPDTRGPTVGFHVPRDGQTSYPVGAPISLLIHETLETTTLVPGLTFVVRPVGGAAIDGLVTFSFDDILTFTPDEPLLENTTYEVVLPAGGIKDAVGNAIDGYSFTFSTGPSVGGNQAPEVQAFTASPWPVAPGGAVDLSAAATDPELASLEYRFDFGDGSARTPWSSATTVQTAYAVPGHYRATVQVRDPEGAVASRSSVVTVVPANPPTPPRHSAPVECDAVGEVINVVNPDNDTVAQLDASTAEVQWEVAACEDPRSIASAAFGELWVTCHDGDRVLVLDAGGQALATVGTGYGSAPVGIVASPDGTTLYVSLQGSGELLRIDAGTRAETGRIVLGPRPRAIALDPTGASAYVTRFLSATNHAEIWDVDTASFTLQRTILVRKMGGSAHLDGTAEGRGTPNYLTAAAVSPDGGHLWFTATKPNTERGLLIGPDLDDDNTVRTIAVQVDLGTGEILRSIDIDNSDSASGVHFSPLGDYLLVTLQGNDELLVLDMLAPASVRGLGSMVTRFGTSFAPQGVCIDPATQRTFVKNLNSRTVTVLETEDFFRLGTLTVPSVEVLTVASESLDPEVLLGKQVFYGADDPRMSGEGYLSCATCHLDGGQDGRSWDFTGRGEGLRNTTTLRGRAGMGHGNVHWSGNFDEVQDFENDIRNAFGGTGFLSDAHFAATAAPLGSPKAGLSPELDALAAYLTSLGGSALPRSPHRNGDGTLTSSALAGALVFQAGGCGSCHLEGAFTDSVVGPGNLHDVGTIRTTSGGRLGGLLPGIDTPTLLGVWSTAPYLHDGSASTLDEVFEIAGGTVLPAENAALSGSAYVIDQYTELNNDDTVRGRAYAAIPSANSSIRFDGVDGGSGGVGAIEFRYSGVQQEVTVFVGGVPYPVAVADTGNEPSWRHVNWGRGRATGVVLAPGASNTIELVGTSSYPNIRVDEILVSTPDDIAAASVHHVVATLDSADRSDLLAYLLQLDGQDAVPAESDAPPELRIKATRLDREAGEQRLKLKSAKTDTAGETFDPTADTLRLTVSSGGSEVETYVIAAGDPGWNVSSRRLTWRATSVRPDGLIFVKVPAAGQKGPVWLKTRDANLTTLQGADLSRLTIDFEMGSWSWLGLTPPCTISATGGALKCR